METVVGVMQQDVLLTDGVEDAVRTGDARVQRGGERLVLQLGHRGFAHQLKQVAARQQAVNGVDVFVFQAEAFL